MTAPVDPALRRALRGTLAGLWAERLARAFWPAVAMALLTWATLGFGVADLPGGRWVVLAGVVALVAATGVGLWRLHPPRMADAQARLDAQLPGRPLSALADSVAVGADDAGARAVWAAHLARARRVLAQARAVPGDLRLARFDQYGLRYMAATAAALAVLFGAPARIGDVRDLAPGGNRAEAIAMGPAWEAWIEPPDYTGRPSLYLNEVERARLQLPVGSRVTVRFYGQDGVMTLHESLSDRPVAEPAAMAQDFTIAGSGRLSIRGPGGRDWEVSAQADAAPQVTLVGQPARERGGVMRQDFAAQDDYGVTGGTVHIALDLDAVERRFGLAPPPEPRDDVTLPLPLPVSGARDAIEDALIEDFSRHPWANLPVVMRLQVDDARAQTGESAAKHVTLPGRRFFDPMAAAVIELRRDLLWTRANAPRVARLMRAISHRPDGAFRNDTARTRFSDTRDALQARLQDSPLDAEARDALAQQMWDLAVLLEDGELADARERLRRAQERLDEAMRNGAAPSEISELMDEMRDAMRDYMRQLAEQPRDRGEAPQDQERTELTQDQLQQMMDRIQQLMEDGRMEEAAQLMAQLDAMLENLQVTQGQGQGGMPMPGDEAMQGLGDTLRGQQGLSDDTFGQLQDEFRDGEGRGNGSGQGARGSPEGEGRASGAGDLAERQRQLAEELREQQLQSLPGEGTAEGDAARDALERGQRAMEDAEQALREGDAAGALSRQADAMEAMREGLRAMDDAQRQDQAARGGAGDEGRDGQGRDPLGRATGQGGELGSDQDMLTDDDVYARARDLLDELRRRSAQMDRPEQELDYLRRLLDRF